MRAAIVAALLALTACAHLDANERDRQRLAWHACAREQMDARGWLSCH